MTTNFEKTLKNMREDKAVRRAIVRRSFLFFFCYYFHEYIEYGFAPFHYEWFNLAQHDDHSMKVISAFRGSGKSTIFSLAYVIWLIISGKAKYVLLISENQHKAQTLLGHIRDMLENNAALKSDLGPFQEERAAWNSVSLVIKNYGAKITAVSTEQSVRGLRHHNHRPDLLVLDDCESGATVKTLEQRDKLSDWFSGDVLPAGHTKTKSIIIGSMLHSDSLIPRLQRRIDVGEINGTYHSTPIIDNDGHSMWPAKYPNAEAIDQEKKRGISEHEWQIEYLLRPPSEQDQVIRPEDIHYYERPPVPADPNFQYIASGVDLAIGQNESNDFVAIVSGILYRKDDWKIYILPHPVNQKLRGPAILERIVWQSETLGNGTPTQMYIEDVAFQQSMIDFVKFKEIPVEGFSPGGHDKRARFISISEFIKSGRVVFPKHGAEQLIEQMVWFGSTRHDDLLDALVILIIKISKRENEGRIIVLPPFTMPEVPDNEALRENDLWRDEQKLAFQQGRLPAYLWYAAQDEYLKRKREILKKTYQEQHRKANEDIKRGTEQHEKQEFKRLMNKRMGR